MLVHMLFLFIDTDDSKLESSSYMVKGVHLLLGEPPDFGFSFAMDVFHKVKHYVQLFKFETKCRSLVILLLFTTLS